MNRSDASPPRGVPERQRQPYGNSDASPPRGVPERDRMPYGTNRPDSPPRGVPERERMPYGHSNSPHQGVPERQRMPYGTNHSDASPPSYGIPERQRMPYGGADASQPKGMPERQRMPYGMSHSNGKKDRKWTSSNGVKEKNSAEILDELVQMNNKNPCAIQIDRFSLELMLKNVKKEINAVSAWGSSKLESWAREMRSNSSYSADLLPKFIAIVSRANFLAMDKIPRDVQILTLLIKLLPADQSRGVVSQVATGEGKSTITALLAAILALKGPKECVDIVTSSPVLARRDATDEKRRKFFAMLGLNVDHNTTFVTGEDAKKLHPCYKSDILYGDLSSFQGDMLRQEFKSWNVRGDRPYRNVIVDEFDHSCVDENKAGKILMLSHEVPQMEYLQGLLIAGWKQWQQIQWITAKAKYCPSKGIYELRGKDSDDATDVVQTFNDKNKFAQDLLADWFKMSIENTEEVGLILPKHLKEYALSQVQNWAKSASTASYVEEGKDYLVEKDANGHTRAKLIDQDTGTVSENTHWSDGVHEFLQIKHGLKLGKESLTTCFSTNISYFRHYGSNIYGLTGTLGCVETQQFLRALYRINMVFIPTYKPKQFREKEGILAGSRQSWKEEIARAIKKKLQKNRSVLVINESINVVDELHQFLRQSLSGIKIRLYRRDETDKSAIEIPLGTKEVILATNLGGRGTDIQIKKDLEESGGMHVIVSFLPDNLRIQYQAYGRTSRQGQPGSAQMILDRTELYGGLQYAKNFKHLIEMRDSMEANSLKKCLTEVVPKMESKSKLFDYFEETLREIRQNHNEKEHYWLLKQLEETWGFWLKKQQSKLDNYENLMPELERLSNNLKQQCANYKEDIFLQLHPKHFISNLKNKPANDKKETPFQNPSYMVLTARSEIFRGQRGIARNRLDEAIKRDEVFAFAAYYYRALANVEMAHIRFINEKKRDSAVSEYEQKAIADLQACSELIEKVIIPRLTAQQVIIKIGDEKQKLDSELSMQQTLKIELLRKQQQYIDKAISVIQNCPSNRGVKLLNTVDPETTYPTGTTVPEEEIQELFLFGVAEFYELGYAKPKRSWWTIIGLALIGAAQIGLGVFSAVASMGASSKWSYKLITQGINDIKTAIRVAMREETFSWKNWWIEKAIDYGMQLLSSFGEWLGKKCPKLQKIMDWFSKKEATPAVKDSTAGEIVRNCLQSEVVGQIKKRVSQAINMCFPEVAEKLRSALNTLMGEYFGSPKLRQKMTNLLRYLSNFAKAIISHTATFLKEIAEILHNFCNKLIDKVQNLFRNNALMSWLCSIGRDYWNQAGLHLVVKNFCEKVEKKIDEWIDKYIPKASEYLNKVISNMPAGMAEKLERRLEKSGIVEKTRIWTKNAAQKVKQVNLDIQENLQTALDTVITHIDRENQNNESEVDSVVEDLQNVLFNAVQNIIEQNGSFKPKPNDVSRLASAFIGLAI